VSTIQESTKKGLKFESHKLLLTSSCGSSVSLFRAGLRLKKAK